MKLKVLLVTTQLIDIRQDGCYCYRALYGTLENMHILGELYILAGQETPNRIATQPIDQKLDFIQPSNVSFLRPMTQNILSYLENGRYNYKLLKKLIPSMDLVIGYLPLSIGDDAFKIAHRLGIPYLSFLVGCPWDMLSNHHRFLARVMAPVYFFSTQNTVLHSDYVHYVTKKFLQSRYPTRGMALGCSDVNILECRQEDLDLRLRRAFIKKSEIWLVTTAHVDIRYKGHEYVIRAIAKLKQQGDSRYRYGLIGKGKGDYLRNLAKSLGVEDQVFFWGRKSSTEVMELLRKSDVYVQPSLQEGLPRAVVEAMSVALPCVGFNTGGIPELLEPNFVVERKNVDGIIRCLRELDNPQVYSQAAIKNFQVAHEYEHDILKRRTVDFFKAVREDIEDKKNKAYEK